MARLKADDRPSLYQLEAELSRIKYKRRYNWVLRSTIYALVVVAALAVLVATLWMPVLQIYGNSMTPSMQDGDIVISVKNSNPQRGDVVAFYYNNKVLVKRIIGLPGDTVNIDASGNVFVNGTPLDEPYLSQKDYGECTTEMPCTVAEEEYFVLGDHRELSVDSRNELIGCVKEDQMVGRIVFRVWPFENFGKINTY